MDADLLQLAAEDLAQVGHEALAVPPLPVHARHDVVVRLGVQGPERQVLELPLDLADAEAVRERRVDVEGLAGDAAALGLRLGLDGPHVVEPVRELDQDDTHVVRHRQQHLADVLGVQLLLGAEGDSAQLGDALDQLGDLLAELALDLTQGQLRVLHGVVQERGRQGGGVEVKVGQDRGDLQRVVHVVLAGKPALAAVRLVGAVVRALHHLPVLGSEVLGDAEKLRDCH